MMARFGYLDGDSFFHQMDPSWKLLWNILFVGMVILNFDLVYSVDCLVYIVVLTLVVSRIYIRRYVRSLMVFLSLALFVAVWKSLYYVWDETEVVHVWFSWGPIAMTREGVVEGVASFFRILVVVSVSLLFTLTTNPVRLVDSLIQIAGLPYRIGYAVYAAMRFIPLYENEARVISNAHQIRGVGETGKGLLSKLRLYRSILIPLLVSGIRRAQRTSIAMDSRAFGAHDVRTMIREANVSLVTKIFVLGHGVAAVVAFYYYIVLGHGAHFIG